MKHIATDIGVIVGRFQIHELHEAHIELIQEIISRHSKNIIFLGTTVAVGTRKNPMDFITRKLMLEVFITSLHTTSSVVILPLPDKKHDKKWSENLDAKVREVYPSGSVTLYGSRDSFIPHYKGIFNTLEMEPKSYINATDIRDKIGKTVMASAEFRAGIIYAIYGLYPMVYSTIDILIRDGDKILLGRKPEEDKWRFIGGFVDPTDASDIAACKREGREETGLELDDFKFIESRRIEDWRYRGVKEKAIMTRFYECKKIFGTPTPGDDIEELKWFKLDYFRTELTRNTQVVGEHAEMLGNYYNNHYTPSIEEL